MSTIIDAVSEVVKKQFERQTFADTVYGTVKAVKPLKIETDQKTMLEDPFLSVAQHITDYEIECEITTDEINGFFVMHEGRQDVQVNPPGFQKGKIKLLNALKVGDRVIMQRFGGGQRYQVIDRIGEDE